MKRKLSRRIMSLILSIGVFFSMACVAHAANGRVSWTSGTQSYTLEVNLSGSGSKHVKFNNGKSAVHNGTGNTPLIFRATDYVRTSATCRPTISETGYLATALQRAGAEGTLYDYNPVGDTIWTLDAGDPAGTYYAAAVVSYKTGDYTLYNTTASTTQSGTVTYAPVRISGIGYIYSSG